MIETQKRHIWRLLHWTLFCTTASYMLMLSILMGFLLSDFFLRAQEPINITILNPNKAIRPDEVISYEATLQKFKKCPVTVWRFIVRQAENSGIEEVGYRDMIPGLFSQGNEELIQTRTTMAHPALAPGPYLLRIYIVSQCSIITRVDKYPDEPFTVF